MQEQRLIFPEENHGDRNQSGDCFGINAMMYQQKRKKEEFQNMSLGGKCQKESGEVFGEKGVLAIEELIWR